jgi:hypothetical protein
MLASEGDRLAEVQLAEVTAQMAVFKTKLEEFAMCGCWWCPHLIDL